MTQNEIEAMARALAMAPLMQQQMVDEAIEGWTESYRQQIPILDDPQVSSAQRFEAFIKLRASAERAVEIQNEKAERERKRLEQLATDRAAEVEETIRRNRLQNEANWAAWRAQCELNRAQGFALPAQPAALPVTPEELANADRPSVYSM